MINEMEIRVINGALDEHPARGGSIILRGVIHPECLKFLKVDDYQRERLGSSASIWKALTNHQALPDIELGMRGQRYQEMKDGTIFLQDPVYIIDGLQRQTGALRYMEATGQDVRLGAVIHFSTDKSWESERFRVLNTTARRVSGNVILRNDREGNPAILTLYGLSMNQADFPLYKRVTWEQVMARHDLITAGTMLKVALRLHRHLQSSVTSTKVSDIAANARKLGDLIGLNKLRSNLVEFFAVINEAWPFNEIDTQSPTPFLRSGFLLALASLLSHHKDFWRDDDKTLHVETDLRRKIGTFKVFDPNINFLTHGSGSSSLMQLARLMVDHINSGKRTKRLTPRFASASFTERMRAEVEQQENEAAEAPALQTSFVSN